MKDINFLEKILIIILIIIALIPLSQLAITAKIIAENQDEYSYTKAICNNSNYCEDYVIKCRKNNMKSLTPTGFAIQKDENWIDERTNEEKYCN